MRDQFSEKAGEWDKVPWKRDLAEQAYLKIREEMAINREWTLADIGGGTGLFTLKFLNDVKNLVVIDTSESMLAILREKIGHFSLEGISIVDSEYDGETFPGESVGLFISMMTLHHIPDLPKLFKDVRKALAPHGKIAFIDLKKEPGDFHNEGVEYFHKGFEEEEIRDMLKEAGFSSISVRPEFSVTKESRYGIKKDYPILLVIASK